MNRIPVIGIAGCSGSGKTTLAEALVRKTGGVHFRLDRYYRDLGHLGYEERCLVNFDQPDAVDSDLLIAHVSLLASGHSVRQPRYDFATHTRLPDLENFQARRLLFVDGIFALHYDGLRRLYDLAIYVDTPDEVCYRRRLARDVAERGRTAESVAAHYAESVRPMAEKYVRPSAAYADLIVNGTACLDSSVEAVLTALADQGTLNLINAGR